MAQKPSIPKGTRDFLPEVMVRRNYIFDTIKSVFKRFGFQPIETPSMENLSTLLGKYGDEGDKLLFRVLNSGDFMSGVEQNGEPLESLKLASKITEKGLRYDLTVPFARFVTMYRDQIAFPFKRYQIQPVWRADRPQKGRYREFYQCDVDIIGSDSLLNEAELVQIVDEVFGALKINVTLKINNRKVLAGIAEYIGKSDALVDITVAIDKLDKIGIDAVNAELAEKGLEQAAIDKLQPILFMKGDTREKLAQLKPLLDNEVGQKGIEELETLFDYIDDMELNIGTELDRHLRPAQRQRRGHQLRRRPHLRRPRRPQPLPRNHVGKHQGALPQLRQERREILPEIPQPGAQARHQRGNLSRCRQDPETNEICQPTRHPDCRHRR